MAIDKRHPLNTDINDINLNNTRDLTKEEIEALQDHTEIQPPPEEEDYR